MPFLQTAAAAATGGVLSDKDNVPAHGSLFAVVERERACQPLRDNRSRLSADFVPAPQSYIRSVPIRQLKSGTKRRLSQALFEIVKREHNKKAIGSRQQAVVFGVETKSIK